MNNFLKKTTYSLLAIIASVSVVLGQNETALPIDPQVKIGKLPNGFTYYIRKNSEPKNRVTIYLVNKVGSVLETDKEQGLAHFLEHMNFNGTTHFPKNELVSYLQKSGIKFGGDLNAFTSFDQTVYQLPLPTDDPVLLQNGFQIMRDWAYEALLDSSEIEKERGVILEEKRLRSNAQQRLRDRYFPVILNDAKYSRRVPIGTEEVLKNFDRSTLLGFYRKWYRPDLQALIVVGDIDVAVTEKTIRTLFSDIKSPVTAPVREKYPIVLNNKNQYFTGTDKEISLPSIQVLVKFISNATKTKADYELSVRKEIFNSILAERISDLSKQPNSPFVFAKSGVNPMLANLSAFATNIAARPANLEKAFKTVWTEIERFKKFGVTTQELERAKQTYLTRFESAYSERDKTPSASYVNEYLQNFTEGEAIPGIEYEYSLCKELATAVSVQDINETIHKYIVDTNRDVLVVGPDKDKEFLPSEEVVNQWFSDVNASTITLLKDESSTKELLTQKPTKGQIVREVKNKILGTTELYLANGVKVVLKPTNFKNDEIKFNAFSPGGTSLYNDSDFESALHAAECVNHGGIGDFSLAQLQKYLSGKRVGVSPFISERFEGLNGAASPTNLETAFQLVYLYFTQPRKDFQLYNTELERTKVSLTARGNDPVNVFADSVQAVLNGYNVRRTAPSVSKIQKINPARAFEIYCERFADASDFTFTFVGSIDVDKIKPLVEQYLGSLPYTSRKENAHDFDIQTPKGKINKEIFKGVEQKSTVKLVYSGKLKYSEQENLRLDALADLLTIKLLQRLREEESGVYGVSATAQSYKFPKPHYSITIAFGCAPANVEKLIQSAKEVGEKIKTDLPLQEDVDKVVNEDLRDTEVKMSTNSFWISYLVSKAQLNEKAETITNYTAEIKKINPQVLKATANKYLSGENFARFVLYPGK